MREQEHTSLPAWATTLLKETPVANRGARDHIMNRVRTMPAPRALASPMRPSRWMRRGLLTPAGSAATTLVFMVVATLRIGGDYMLNASLEQSARVVGDTIVQRVAGAGATSLRDTLLDTLRIVEFVVRGRGVQSAGVTGDFNDWRNTSLQRDAAGSEWRGRVMVSRDALRFAYVVNDRRLPATPIPAAAAPTTSDSARSGGQVDTADIVRPASSARSSS